MCMHCTHCDDLILFPVDFWLRRNENSLGSSIDVVGLPVDSYIGETNGL